MWPDICSDGVFVCKKEKSYRAERDSNSEGRQKKKDRLIQGTRRKRLCANVKMTEWGRLTGKGLDMSYFSVSCEAGSPANPWGYFGLVSHSGFVAHILPCDINWGNKGRKCIHQADSLIQPVLIPSCLTQTCKVHFTVCAGLTLQEFRADLTRGQVSSVVLCGILTTFYRTLIWPPVMKNRRLMFTETAASFLLQPCLAVVVSSL